MPPPPHIVNGRPLSMKFSAQHGWDSGWKPHWQGFSPILWLNFLEKWSLLAKRHLWEWSIIGITKTQIKRKSTFTNLWTWFFHIEKRLWLPRLEPCKNWSHLHIISCMSIPVCVNTDNFKLYTLPTFASSRVVLLLYGNEPTPPNLREYGIRQCKIPIINNHYFWTQWEDGPNEWSFLHWHQSNNYLWTFDPNV